MPSGCIAVQIDLDLLCAHTQTTCFALAWSSLKILNCGLILISFGSQRSYIFHQYISYNVGKIASLELIRWQLVCVWNAGMGTLLYPSNILKEKKWTSLYRDAQESNHNEAGLVAVSDAHPIGDQDVEGSIPARSGNILSWRLIMKYFLRSFSPFRWFKKGSSQFLAKECAHVFVNQPA